MMPVILGGALVIVVAAPFLGRWRAKVWLKNNVPVERQITHLPRPELREPSV
jgi:hypothetical protein